MSDAAAKPSLRAENRRRTESRIIDAATDLVGEQGDMGFTMPQVSERSGVALRTLYRYFATKQDLVDALSRVADQVDGLPLPEVLDRAGLEAWLAEAWANLLEVEPFLRAQHQGAAGAAIRRTRTPHHRGATLAVVDAMRPDLDPTVRDELVDQLLVLGSSTTMFELIDVIGVEPARAAQIAARAMVALIEHAPGG